MHVIIIRSHGPELPPRRRRARSEDVDALRTRPSSTSSSHAKELLLAALSPYQPAKPSPMLAFAIASGPAAPVPTASGGDPLTTDAGFLGGAVTSPPDEQRGPASWTQFAGMGLLTGAKYTAAGVETGLDWITGGAFQASSDSASNTGNRFSDLNKDTAVHVHHTPYSSALRRALCAAQREQGGTVRKNVPVLEQKQKGREHSRLSKSDDRCVRKRSQPVTASALCVSVLSVHQQASCAAGG